MKPSWDQAPDGAKYLAMDITGYWYWYEEQPIWNDDNGRWVYGGRSWNAASAEFHADDTLEARP